MKELQTELLESGNRLITALESDVAAGQALAQLQNEMESTRAQLMEMESLKYVCHERT